MKQLLLALILLTATAVQAQSAPHHFLGRVLGMQETRDLVIQAVMYSRYEMPKVMPLIDVIPDALWVATQCPGETSAQCSMLGYYSPTEDPMVLRVRDTPRYANRPYSGIAVHEITHYLQELSGWGYNRNSCMDVAAHEMEAYEVEYVNDLAQGRVRPFEMAPILGSCLSQQ